MGLSIRKTLMSFAISLLSCSAALAANITGTITDSSDEPLIEATVRLLAAKDSAFVKGVTTDINGKFSINNVKKGRYIIQTSYIGYNNHYEDVRIGESSLTLKPIVMKESTVMLKETVITAVKTEIVAKEDTLEYNAGSYKTQPNAVMEDLLKKLPGVDVDSDGKILLRRP